MRQSLKYLFGLHLVCIIIMSIGCGGCGGVKPKHSEMASTTKNAEIISKQKIGDISQNVSKSSYQNLPWGERVKLNYDQIIKYLGKKKSEVQIMESNLDTNALYYMVGHTNVTQIYIYSNLTDYAPNPTPKHPKYASFGQVSEIGYGWYNKLILFDTLGEIRREIDLEPYNPYTRKKEPRIEGEEYYDAESISQYPMKQKSDRKLNHSKIKKFLTASSILFNEGSGTYTLFFTKIGMTNEDQVIDYFTSTVVLDSEGKKIFQSPELNIGVVPLINTVSIDGKYYVICFKNVEDMNNMSGDPLFDEGFILYDIHSGKEIYRYILSEEDYNQGKEWGGAFFNVQDPDLLKAVNTLPYSKIYSEEKILVDFKERLIYKRNITREEKEEISKNYFKKYKTQRRLIELFEFKQEKF